MAVNPSSNANPSGEPTPAAENYVPLTFEDKLHQFWQKNRAIVLGLCVVVLAAILGKGVWEKVQHNKELDVQAAFQAANSPEKLRAFVNAHPGHPLAGVAELQMADEAYSAGRVADALTGYEKAAASLKTGPLAVRAQLGKALAKIQTGKTADGISELKLIAEDTAQFKAVRSEATYHLASLALEAGNAEDLQKYVGQLNQIDPASMWARRAMNLQANLPRSSAPAPAAAAPASSNAGPSVQVKLPSK